MGKVYVRVDDRLIHGQTVVAWCPALQIKEILGIDDVSAKNPMLQSIMTMGVPKIYNTHIVTTEQAKELLKNGFEDNLLVIVKYPSILKEIKEEIKGCEQIILGNLAKKDDSIYQVTGATGIFFLSEQDKTDLQALVDEGFKVTFQQLPNAGGKDWEEVAKSI